MPTFTPPTVKQRMHATHPLLSRYSIDVGQSVVLRDGAYQLTPFPWIGELEGLTEGTDYFMGGRTYVITSDIADALEGDGFTTDDQGDGFNEGAFGSEGYGA